MKRLTFKFFLGLGALYFLGSLFFASSYIQGRLLASIRQVVEPLGIQLNIESVEVSLLLPKVYLNRVVLRTKPNAAIPLPEPISIERIKVAVNPLSVLYGQLTLSEVAFFQPKIILKGADELYSKAKSLLESSSKWKVNGGQFNIEIQKIGVVDAYILATLKDPKVGVDSGRFTFFVEKSARDQFTFTSNFTNLTLDRGPLHTVIRSADFDFDLTKKSVRANRIKIESEGLNLLLKGASSLPIKLDSGPESFRVTYEIETSLKKLQEVEELKTRLPALVKGEVNSSGALEKTGLSYSGSGKVELKNVLWDGFDLGTGQFQFFADGKQVALKNLQFNVDKGKIESEKIAIDLSAHSPFEGELNWVDVELNHLLAKLKIKQDPLYLTLKGGAKLHGELFPLNLQGQVNSDVNQLTVIAHLAKPVSPENTVINVEKGKLSADFNVHQNSGSLKSQIQILDGNLAVEGQWGESSPLSLNVEGKNLSLAKLGKIQELSLGGNTDLKGRIDLESGEPVISGDFDLKNGEVAQVVLGPVRGKVLYQNDLLAFESLEVPALETIRGQGFVDFKPKDTRYRFDISTKRASVDQVFQFFRKADMGFTPPKNGDLAARVVLEGGHDSHGIQVSASGSVRGIQWFDEKWLGGSFSLVYRNDFVEISRATLTKSRGALGFQGVFKGDQSKLKLQSYGLKLEDLDHVRGSPVSGEIMGELNLEGNLDHPTGNGELKLVKTLFRNQSLGDSNVSIHEGQDKTEFVGNLFGNSLQGRLVSVRQNKKANSDIQLNFKNCNVTPVLSMLSGKDLPSFGAIKATGDVKLNGNLNQWESVSGHGNLSDVELDLKTAPVKNVKPILFTIEKGAVNLIPFELLGQDSLISGYAEFVPGKKIKGALDAKVDLLYLQPFIPGLEYGTGKVTAGVRFSGNLPKFEMLGNLTLEDGSFRIQNLAEDFRNVRAQISITEEKLNIDRFEARHGGGNLSIKGLVDIDRFSIFAPDLQLITRGVGFRHQNALSLKVSGNLKLKGDQIPYLLSGDCTIDEGKLSDFNLGEGTEFSENPTLEFDLHCKADKGFLVDTEVMQAEWRGDFKLLGDNNKLGLVGSAESLKGAVFFKETKFDLVSGSVKFEDPEKVVPRFNVSAKSYVKEQRTQVPIEYEVNLSAYGTPQDYKIRLNSVPALAEPELIALLVLGVTSRTQDDNYVDFGSTLVGKNPLQTKLQNELGVNIKVNMQRNNISGTSPVVSTGSLPTPATSTSGLPSPDTSVPTVKIQKDITNKTKLSYSSTLDQSAMKEFKIEQLLDENFTVNAMAVDKFRGTNQTDSVKSYGLDFRYRFQFE
jgi:TamB, inner membrane protein subunit of TAM complex